MTPSNGTGDDLPGDNLPGDDLNDLLGAMVEATDARKAAPAAPSLHDVVRALNSLRTGLPGAAPTVARGLVEEALGAVERVCDTQVAQVTGDIRFRDLAGRWRALAAMVDCAGDGGPAKVQVLSATAAEWRHDATAGEFDDTALFARLYIDPYMADADPLSVLVIDETFGQRPDEIAVLSAAMQSAATAHTVVLATADPAFFGANDLSSLTGGGRIGQVLAGPQAIAWRGLREAPEAGHLGLVASGATLADGTEITGAMAAGIAIAAGVAATGWPAYAWPEADAPGASLVVDLDDRDAGDLAEHGIIPLADGATGGVAPGALPSAMKPTHYRDAQANVLARAMAQLAYTMAISRYAQAIKLMARDGTLAGDAMTMSAAAGAWLTGYVAESPEAEHPLTEGSVSIVAVPDAPGAFDAEIALKPGLGFGRQTATCQLTLPLPDPV